MEVNINNVNVSFPYQPYPVQNDFMSKVIESIDTGQYALLESPTGTGKTLSLLCSALSWRRQNKAEVQIVYASRTHSQLSNVMKELKKTVFRPSVSHVASRSILCLNDFVRNRDVGDQARFCYQVRKLRTCIYANDQQIISAAETLLNRCLDIEEFIAECDNFRVCPYFTAQINSKKAGLVLTPYTYLVDPIVSSYMPMEYMSGSILILDEAHNFPDQCSNSMSFDLPFYLVSKAHAALTKIHNANFAVAQSQTTIDFFKVGVARAAMERLYRTLLSLESDSEFSQIISLKQTENNFQALQKDVNFLFQIFDSAKIDEVTGTSIRLTLDDVLAQAIPLGLENDSTYALERVMHFLQTVFHNSQINRQEDYQYLNSLYTVCLTNQPAISLLCFSSNPGFMRIINEKKPRTVILTSGTLSPMDSFAQEIDPSNQLFPIRLENNHVANPNQIFVGIVGKGVDNNRFHFVYTNRKSDKLKKDCVKSLATIYNIVPSGALTFFPSFSMLEEYAPLLLESNQSKKRIFIEPRNASKMQLVFNNFQQAAPKGAALMAVCRGKMSEGLDFADDFARCVCVVGIPFPNYSDFHVEFKREWLERRQAGSGKKWYIESAIRAVNQAIGRAIRHKDDYAAILLMDERYNGFKNLISKWIRPSIHVIDNWEKLISELQNFFFEKENIIYTENKTKVMMSNKNITKNSIKKLDKKEEEKEIVPLHKRKVDDSRPVSLQMSHSKEFKQKLTPIDMQKGLASLFTLSKTDSQQNLKQDKSQVKIKQNDIFEKLAEKAKFKEEKICAFCNKKEGQMKKMKCSHFVCLECFDFMSSLQMKCPKCKK
ncbi:putative helicase [Histomonas meleagridis]|uniref:putative helicase n=1 Tax=Histomonas meleagridis TaxID=135588 RepID=UPI003559578D|nr:putative helicase [Histomonas meleagridis]KAH0804197.1 putative helicase [Histomonas meleagridis]